MDAFQSCFEYQMMIGCGIPEITLSGTGQDCWRWQPEAGWAITYA